MLSVVRLRVVMLSVVMRSVVVRSTVYLSVIMLSVVDPKMQHYAENFLKVSMKLLIWGLYCKTFALVINTVQYKPVQYVSTIAASFIANIC